MDNNKEKDNVIEFPRERVEATEAPNTPSEQNRLSFALERKKVIFSASLLSVFLLAAVLNRVVVGSPDANLAAEGSRSLASVSDTITYDRNTSWEHKLAEEISKKAVKRDPAGLGHAPSTEDKIRFGLLEGKYAFRFNSGKLSELQFTDNAVSSDSPKYVDLKDFLSKSRPLLPVHFETSVSKSRTVVDDRINEVYHLLNAKDASVAEVRFELDTYGRLLSMKVVANNSGH